MRRFLFFFFCLAACLVGASFFYKEIVGVAAKLWTQISTGYSLSYRTLNIRNGSLVFEGVSLFNKENSRPFLETEKLELHVDRYFPLEGSIHLQAPHFTLCKQKSTSFVALQKKSKSRWSFNFTEGFLDWSDEAIPKARINLERKEAGSILRMDWQERFLEATLSAAEEKKALYVKFQHLPLDWIVQLAELVQARPPISSCKGEIEGSLDGFMKEGVFHPLSVHLEGKKLSFEWSSLYPNNLKNWEFGKKAAESFALERATIAERQGASEEQNYHAKLTTPKTSFSSCLGIICKGDLSIDTRLEEEGALERLWLHLKEGELINPISSLKKLDLLLTFQQDIGMKWESKGEALGKNLPLSFSSTGKGAFDPLTQRFAWMKGEANLGQATAAFSQEKGWTLAWQQLTSQEGAILQGFGALFFPKLLDWFWNKGGCSGEISGNSLEPLRIGSFVSHNLEGKKGEVAFGFDSLVYKQGTWTAANAFLDGPSMHLDHCLASWDLLEKKGSIEARGEIPWKVEASLDYKKGRLEIEKVSGQIKDFYFSGRAAVDFLPEETSFAIAFDQFSGDISPWAPIAKGSVNSLASSSWVKGKWDSKLQWLDWSIACQLQDVEAPLMHGSKFCCRKVDVFATQEKIDLFSAKGSLFIPLGEKEFEIPFTAPKIQIANEDFLFDLRIDGKLGDFARFVGEKKQTVLRLDPAKSHIAGSPFAFEKFEIDDQGFSKVALQHKNGLMSLNGAYERGQGALWECALEKASFMGYEFPLSLSLREAEGQWELSSFVFGPLAITSKLSFQEGRVWIDEGKAQMKGGVYGEFQGKISSLVKADFTVDQLKADLSSLHPHLSGKVKGQGCFSLTPEGMEADLDCFMNEGSFGQFAIENKKALHVSISSEKFSLTGIDAEIKKNGLVSHAKIELLELFFQQERFFAKNGHLHLPIALLGQPELFELPFQKAAEIDVALDFEGSFDRSIISGTIKQGTLPFENKKIEIKQTHFCFDEKEWLVEGLFALGEKWIKGQANVSLQTSFQGRFILEEEKPLIIDWRYEEKKGLFVESIEGFFGGAEASFHTFNSAEPSKLIGSVRFDAAQAATWLPEDIAKFFRSLKMGKGYELQGHLWVDPKDWKKTEFKGIFSGKQIELAGCEFRTLLAQTQLSSSFVHIYDLQISDSAGKMNLQEVKLEGKKGEPWTIHVPLITVHDLRPSLLHAPGREPGPLTPLVIRELAVHNLSGLLDHLETYKATGDVVFINSFKRGKTVFDLPSNVFGRLIGLDLELLIPVTGEFSFELKENFFHLLKLQHAYSEDNRSEFFLADDGYAAGMDMEGNVHLVVKMKQFVLFKFTEAFAISIEGTLKDPQFRLQRKNKLLPFGG